MNFIVEYSYKCCYSIRKILLLSLNKIWNVTVTKNHNYIVFRNRFYLRTAKNNSLTLFNFFQLMILVMWCTPNSKKYCIQKFKNLRERHLIVLCLLFATINFVELINDSDTRINKTNSKIRRHLFQQENEKNAIVCSSYYHHVKIHIFLSDMRCDCNLIALSTGRQPVAKRNNFFIPKTITTTNFMFASLFSFSENNCNMTVFVNILEQFEWPNSYIFYSSYECG